MTEKQIKDVPGNLSWKQSMARRRRPILRSSIWQLMNTLVPYFALWGLMIWTLNISYWITLALAIVAAGFLGRIFIIFHDCAHGSFTASRPVNRFLEFFTGVLTFTPYRQWRKRHALHHATSGDLDGRGSGDVWTLTVQEYLDASRWTRLAYRIVRSPILLFVIGPLYLFLIHNRIPSRAVGSRDRRGVHMTNGTLMAAVALMSLTIGIKAYLLIQLPIILVAGFIGVWLFYVQHQFEGVEWDRRQDWDFENTALRGSSFYRLPKVLQWFTGNIGFHHVHHLCPAIPNYSLEKCHKENPMFQQVRALTLGSSLKSISYRLWDERRRELVGFGQVRGLRRAKSMRA